MILVAIATCESNQRQFKADGVHLIRDYATGDHVGYFQISQKLHAKTALKMGMDIKTKEGNIAYALYLYKLHGTRDWNASKHCWKQSA